MAKLCLLWQIFVTSKIFCCDKHNFGTTKVLSQQAYFCHKIRCVLLWQKWYLWQLLPMIEKKHFQKKYGLKWRVIKALFIIGSTVFKKKNYMAEELLNAHQPSIHVHTSKTLSLVSVTQQLISQHMLYTTYVTYQLTLQLCYRPLMSHTS